MVAKYIIIWVLLKFYLIATTDLDRDCPVFMNTFYEKMYLDDDMCDCNTKHSCQFENLVSNPQKVVKMHQNIIIFIGTDTDK